MADAGIDDAAKRRIMEENRLRGPLMARPCPVESDNMTHYQRKPKSLSEKELELRQTYRIRTLSDLWKSVRLYCSPRLRGHADASGQQHQQTTHHLQRRVEDMSLVSLMHLLLPLDLYNKLCGIHHLKLLAQALPLRKTQEVARFGQASL